MMMFSQLFRSTRPQQWLKNLIVFAALVFSLNIFHDGLILRSTAAFVLFCAASSAVYLFNDIADIEHDRLHPVKSLRPIASGAVAVSTARWMSLILALASLVGGMALSMNFAVVIALYLTLQALYTLKLKNVVILDVMVIALGFVLRAIAGAVVIGVTISHWLLITTLFLAMFLGFGKRRHELVLLNEQANGHRSVLNDYSPRFLDQMMGIVTTSTVIVYMLYTTSDRVISRFGDIRLVYTMPFVLYGIFRYLYLIHKKDLGDDPSRTLLTDLPLLADVGLWIISVVVLLYYARI